MSKNKDKLKSMINDFCCDNNYEVINLDENLNDGIILLHHHEYSNIFDSYIEIDLFDESVRPYKLLVNDKLNRFADVLVMYELIELYNIMKFFKENC